MAGRIENAKNKAPRRATVRAMHSYRFDDTRERTKQQLIIMLQDKVRGMNAHQDVTISVFMLNEIIDALK